MIIELGTRHLWRTLLDGPDKGIIPLTCSELFVRVEDKKAADPHINFTVEVSYIEVCCTFRALQKKPHRIPIDL